MDLLQREPAIKNRIAFPDTTTFCLSETINNKILYCEAPKILNGYRNVIHNSIRKHYDSRFGFEENSTGNIY